MCKVGNVQLATSVCDSWTDIFNSVALDPSGFILILFAIRVDIC